jgi:predicted ABC-type ATPase
MENQDFYVVVVLGVNGSGKTTLANELARHLEIPLINMDLIGRRPFTSVEDYNRMMDERLQIARSMMDDQLQRRQSFMTELALSTVKDLEFLKHIKQRSATLITVLVFTRDMEINISRISNRVQTGGHHVPLEKIERRYPKFLANMPLAIDESDICFVYDNSQWYQNILMKFEAKKINLIGIELEKDDWIQAHLVKHLEKTNEILSVSDFIPKGNHVLFHKIYNGLSNILERLNVAGLSEKRLPPGR